jgi:hypothetical protein
MTKKTASASLDEGGSHHPTCLNKQQETEVTGSVDLRRRRPKPECRYGWSQEPGTIRPDTSGGSSSPWTNVLKLVTAINDEHL